ncbi:MULTISPECIES: hypothetical protein [unclassified Spiroplasma]
MNFDEWYMKKIKETLKIIESDSYKEELKKHNEIIEKHKNLMKELNNE